MTIYGAAGGGEVVGSIIYIFRVGGSPLGQNFADDTSKCIFVNETVCILISLQFVLKSSIDNIPALVQIMARCQIGDKPLSEPLQSRFSDAYAAFGEII